MKSVVWRGVIYMALVLSALILSSCATTNDSENESARPWNSPRNWEHGLPTGIYEQR